MFNIIYLNFDKLFVSLRLKNKRRIGWRSLIIWVGKISKCLNVLKSLNHVFILSCSYIKDSSLEYLKKNQMIQCFGHAMYMYSYVPFHSVTAV